MTSSVGRLKIISITLLFLWVFGLCYIWRAIFHDHQDTKFRPTPGLSSRDDDDRQNHSFGNYTSIRVSHNQSEERRQRRKHKRKRKQKHVETKLPLPIINVGYPKAGTSSIFSFFQQQGFRSQHWYCSRGQVDPQRGGPFLMADCMMENLKANYTLHNRTMLHGCGHFEVYSEINGPRCGEEKGCLLEDGTVDSKNPGPRIFLPQHFNLQQLHDALPNSTWILNKRSVMDWIESVMKWDDLQHQFANEYYAQRQIDRLPRNETEMRWFLKTIYLEHNDLIRDFVRRNPGHALVEVNITDADAGMVLADSFGLDPSRWTKRNQRWEFSWRQANTFMGSITWWFLVVFTTAYLFSIMGVTMFLG
jgi:hypothetical protein